MALFLFNKGKGVQSMSEKNVRLKKRKLTCGIKNCRERESRYITKSGDFQNTPNLCDDCLEKAYELISPLENVPGGAAYGTVHASTGSGKVIRVKKKKLMCAVKGCGSRESWYISACGDFYGSPNICLDCLTKAYAERFQSADLSGVDVVCSEFEGDGSLSTHPTKNASTGLWEFSNAYYYLNSYLFKAGDEVSITVTASQTGTDNIIEVNGVTSSFSSETVIVVPKTVLTKPILISGALGSSFTVKVNYANIAEAAAAALQADGGTPALLDLGASEDSEESAAKVATISAQETAEVQSGVQELSTAAEPVTEEKVVSKQKTVRKRKSSKKVTEGSEKA